MIRKMNNINVKINFFQKVKLANLLQEQRKEENKNTNRK